ncbi:hypothetical protein AMJ85_06455 [candidate division BRC1 bacterium SM23_51]|nr:MAG: hypothetical protein AMJ85_06455 [candidate division BRC1 bacterium SM23_51]
MSVGRPLLPAKGGLVPRQKARKALSGFLTPLTPTAVSGVRRAGWKPALHATRRPRRASQGVAVARNDGRPGPGRVEIMRKKSGCQRSGNLPTVPAMLDHYEDSQFGMLGRSKTNKPGVGFEVSAAFGR